MWKESIWRSPCEGSGCPVDTGPLSPKPPGQAGSPAAGIGTLGVCEGAGCGTCGVHAMRFSPAFFLESPNPGRQGRSSPQPGPPQFGRLGPVPPSLWPVGCGSASPEDCRVLSRHPKSWAAAPPGRRYRSQGFELVKPVTATLTLPFLLTCYRTHVVNGLSQ